jgi:hypothetical protein
MPWCLLACPGPREQFRSSRTQSGQSEQPTPESPEFDIQAGQEQQERQPHEREDLDGKVGCDPSQARQADDETS